MRSRLVAALCIGTGLGASVACSAVLGIKDFTSGDADSHDGGTADDARGGSDGSGGACTSTGDAATGATSGVGCPCTQGGQLACNGNAQSQTLICSGGVWNLRSTCPAGQYCDSRFGGSAGTCASIDVTCMGANPGQAVCSSPTTAVQCGPDLVSDTPLATCSNQACVNGECGGACVPNATQCSGDTLQTCGADGKWHNTMTCAESCSDAGCGSFPSCTGGGDGTGSDCGGAGGDAGTSDCCASYPVSGGSFFRSYDGVSPGDTNPVYPATVSGFRLDAYEATIGRFRKFVAATANGWRPTAGSGKHAHLNGGAGLANVGMGDAGASEPGWLPSWNPNLESDTGSWNSAFSGCPGATWTNNAGAGEHLPINCVTWYEAYAFCIWDGGFLPSEAEWNFAASGGSDQRVYPWSPPSTTVDADAGADAGASLTAIDCAHANFSPMGMAACVGTPNDVGSESPLGDGRFGQSDLAGNVWEWTLDSYDTPYVVPCVDCSNVAPLGSPVTRGGSFSVSGPALISSYRSPSLPAVRDNSVGVRCARSP